jgi:6,7-dimethyl-8-ribityllumazine synthase
VPRKTRKKARRHSWRSVQRSSKGNKSSHGFAQIRLIFEIEGPVTAKQNKNSSRPLRIRAIEGNLSATGRKFGIVVSRFNEFITERLLRSAYDGLLRSGAKEQDIEIVRVPGSFEIPSAARTLAQTKKYDAIICLGCLLRGDTAHYDVIVNEVARGIGQSAQETGVPHAFGVLTCENLEQAIDRAGLKMGNKGFEAALAAVEMANLTKAVVGRTSSVVGTGTKAVSSQPTALRKSQKRKRSDRPKKSGR